MVENINLIIREFYKLDYKKIQNGGKECSKYLNDEFKKNNIIDGDSLYSKYDSDTPGFYFTLPDEKLDTIKYLLCADKPHRLVYILKLDLNNVSTTKREGNKKDLKIKFIDNNFYDYKNNKCYNDCVYKVIAY